jgi:hypothetical protein
MRAKRVSKCLGVAWNYFVLSVDPEDRSSVVSESILNDDVLWPPGADM